MRGGTRVLTGEQVFLNVGTHAAIPSVRDLRENLGSKHLLAKINLRPFVTAWLA